MEDWAAGINGAEDDDEALRIAIALSLGEDPGERAGGQSGQSGPGMVDLTQDDVADGDGGDGRSSEVTRPSRPPQQPAPAPDQQQPASTFSTLGLDRKKMEEERLARLNKRKASQLEDVQPPARATQRPRIADVSSLSTPVAPTEKAESAGSKVTGSSSTSQSNPPTSQRQKIAGVLPSSTPKKEDATNAKAAAPASAPSSSSDRLPFPRGVVKKTWAYGHPRTGDDIKLEEVLQKQHLQMAVLSSYQWDEEFLLRKIDIARTKLILVAFAVDDMQVRSVFIFYEGGEESCADC